MKRSILILVLLLEFLSAQWLWADHKINCTLGEDIDKQKSFDLHIEDGKVKYAKVQCKQYKDPVFIDRKYLSGFEFKQDRSTLGQFKGLHPMTLEEAALKLEELLNKDQNHDCLKKLKLNKNVGPSEISVAQIFGERPCLDALKQVQNIGDFFQGIDSIKLGTMSVTLDATHARSGSANGAVAIPDCSEWGQPKKIYMIELEEKVNRADLVSDPTKDKEKDKKEKGDKKGKSKDESGKTNNIGDGAVITNQSLTNQNGTSSSPVVPPSCGPKKLVQFEKDCNNQKLIVTCLDNDNTTWDSCVNDPIHFEWIPDPSKPTDLPVPAPSGKPSNTPSNNNGPKPGQSSTTSDNNILNNNIDVPSPDQGTGTGVANQNNKENKDRK